MCIFADIEQRMRMVSWFKDQDIIYWDGMPEEADQLEVACILVFEAVDNEVVRGVNGVAWMHYGVRIDVRSETPESARERLRNLSPVLDTQDNIFINGTMYRSIRRISPPMQIERDPKGTVRYGISYNVVRRET